ncbi:MAG: cytochrome c oxidase subunit 3 family protein [Azonexus sp.]|nr:cytochrome c oxidase subunit 3 family protein [Betaproteobacteria bacterium]MBK8918501.1 cytochrome c oxidase subunit 3 family protein [Betaproteobacteria bacterium]MBP6035479.1 cytochrome c oxidase subunit 3 family protein [Azonexus sp.]MBP6906397.1 cytochrome c oxidase subunit 3 family protein [Azonexus sp.]
MSHAAQMSGTARRFPGNKGIWVGISCEFLEFAVMFALYFIARAHHPEAFVAGAERLSRIAGTAITLVMVSSSFLVAASVDALRAGLRPRALACLSAALVLALAYPLVKFLEIGWNLDQGIGGNSGIFFTVYYYLTFNHLVHASWGIIGMVWVLARLAWGAYTPEEHSGLEALGSYWHATDIIWLVIFPLFYVVN